jgi:hypothetical protein
MFHVEHFRALQILDALLSSASEFGSKLETLGSSKQSLPT